MPSPGVVPLRPLTLGDLFGGAFQTIRRNPRATVGMAAVVTFAFMLVPILATIVLGLTDLLPSMDLSLGQSSSSAAMDSNLGLTLSSLVASAFGLLASLVVTGLVVRVVEGAVIGRRVTAGDAWARSRGRLLPLLGLTLLSGLVLLVVVGIPVGFALAVGLTVGSEPLTVALVVLAVLGSLVVYAYVFFRYLVLAVPAMMSEDLGIRASMRRSAELTRGQFWRTLGIYVLARLAASFVGQVIAIPFAVLGVVLLFALPSSWGLAGLMLSSHVSTILTGALLGPFTACVLALMYVDERFRKEGMDIALLEQTLGAQGRPGVPGAPGSGPYR